MQQVIPAISLEITVLLLGVLMLFAESFSRRADRSHMARYAIGVLLAVLGLSFFTKAAPESIEAGSYWAVYAVDAIAMFFKRIALAHDHRRPRDGAGVSRMSSRGSFPVPRPGGGTGEFYCLPVFTCAGLMFMASAVDFILIFVSLELVTISFYVARRLHAPADAHRSRPA